MGEGGQQMTALVVEANNPIDNRIKAGKHSLGALRILIEGPNPIFAGGWFKLDRDHWPVAGMELPVTIDPADPAGFEVLWDAVPSIEQRVAANDPTLADPLGTRKRTMAALHASGITPHLLRLPDGRRVQQDPHGVALATEAAALAAGGDDQLEGLRQSVERAAESPAPSGKTRAVVLIATSEVTVRNTGVENTTYTRDRHGRHAAVLAVNPPGSAPYAVFEPKFKHPGGKGVAGVGLPALVSSTDAADVEVLWKEVPSIKEANRQTAAAATQNAHSLEEFTQGVASPPPAPPAQAAPGQGAPAMPQIPANMQAMIAQNAKLALAATKDPAMRKLLIDQYRAAGIQVDEDEAG